jgi:hypothetical protein
MVRVIREDGRYLILTAESTVGSNLLHSVQQVRLIQDPSQPDAYIVAGGTSSGGVFIWKVDLANHEETFVNDPAPIRAYCEMLTSTSSITSMHVIWPRKSQMQLYLGCDGGDLQFVSYGKRNSLADPEPSKTSYLLPGSVTGIDMGLGGVCYAASTQCVVKISITPRDEGLLPVYGPLLEVSTGVTDCQGMTRLTFEDINNSKKPSETVNYLMCFGDGIRVFKV